MNRVIILIFTFFTLIFCSAETNNNNKYLNFKLPEKYIDDSLYVIPDQPIIEQWWRELNDTILTELINQALKVNWNLQEAVKNIEVARALLQNARSAYFPAFDLEGGWMRERNSKNISAAAALEPGYTSYYSGAISASWEIDLFGSIRQNVLYRKNLYKASKDDYFSTMVSVTSTLAQAYINLRMTQNQIAIIESNIISQKQILDITQARYNAGLNSELDVSQAKALYYNTKASLASYKTAQTKYLCSVAIMIAQVPGNIRDWLLSSSKIPDIQILVPTSIPANIIRQRPDLLSAEKNIQAQSDYLGIQKREWFPSVFVDGEIGFSGHHLNKTFKRNGFMWEVAPTLKWTIFNGGARTAAISQARAELQTAVIKYNYSVQDALQEVDVAIADYNNSVIQLSDIRTATYAAEKSMKLSLRLYKDGLSDYYNVLDSQKTLLTYQLSLLSTEGSMLNALISLYSALGGGWPINEGK